jgi:hypothetical protein
MKDTSKFWQRSFFFFKKKKMLLLLLLLLLLLMFPIVKIQEIKSNMHTGRVANIKLFKIAFICFKYPIRKQVIALKYLLKIGIFEKTFEQSHVYKRLFQLLRFQLLYFSFVNAEFFSICLQAAIKSYLN